MFFTNNYFKYVAIITIYYLLHLNITIAQKYPLDTPTYVDVRELSPSTMIILAVYS